MRRRILDQSAADHLLTTDSREWVGTSGDGQEDGSAKPQGSGDKQGGFVTSRNPLGLTGTQEVAPVGGLVPPGTFAHVGASGGDVT